MQRWYKVKAVIMEIHKDYCIVVTGDGQFLKRKIPEGVFEIGDEIMIDQEYFYEPVKPAGVSRVRKFAVTASIASVVIAALVLGIGYMRNYLSEDAAWFREYQKEELIVVGEETQEAVEEEEVREQAEAVQAEPEEAVIYENVYTLEEITEFEEFISGIMFSYSIDGTSLKIRLENVNSTPYFNGVFKITMLLNDGSESETSEIRLQGFKPGQVRENLVIIRTGQTRFKLQVIKMTY
jgi:hypothetical protein